MDWERAIGFGAAGLSLVVLAWVSTHWPPEVANRVPAPPKSALARQTPLLNVHREPVSGLASLGRTPATGAPSGEHDADWVAEDGNAAGAQDGGRRALASTLARTSPGSADVAGGSMPHPTPTEPLELPVVTPAAAKYPSTSGDPRTPGSEDQLSQIRRYVEQMRPPTASRAGQLPVPTVPPVAVPRELAQAQATPMRTPSVFQRVRNIPSHLIRTPMPIESNAPSEDPGSSPAADPSLATDAGQAPRWSDPAHPLVQPVRKGQTLIPTVVSGPPRVGPPSQATGIPPEEPPDTLAREERRAGATPAPGAGVVSYPPQKQVPLVETRATQAGVGPNESGGTSVRAPEARSRPSTPDEPAQPPVSAPSAQVATVAQAGHGAERTLTAPPSRREVRTTGVFTIRKKGAVVTFSNVPFERIESDSSQTTSPAAEAAVNVGEAARQAQASSQSPAPAETAPPASMNLNRFEPDGAASSRIERGVEELAKRGGDSKLAQQLVSRVVAASVGTRVLTRHDIERRLQAAQLLRGVTFSEDQRATAEGVIVQDWTEKTAVAAIARDKGLSVSDEEVHQEIERRKSRLGPNLPEALRRAGFTQEEIEQEIRDALLVDKYVQKVMAESYPEEKLKEIYEAHPDRYVPSRRLHVREIFKEKKPGLERQAREAIERLRLEIAKGASFEELARRESDSPTRQEDGDLGWIDATKPIAPRQAEALANLRPGDVSDVIELGDGYQLLKLVEIEEPKPGFEGAKRVVEAAVRDHIIGLAYDEALARYEVKMRNKRLQPRLQWSVAGQELAETSSPVPGMRTRDKSDGGRDKSTVPAPATKQRSAELGGGVPERSTSTATPTSKRRWFPFSRSREH